MVNKKNHSLVIIGAGPAALTASIYASRYNLNHIVIGKALGGQIFEAHKVCNFPTEQDISGAELATKLKDHAQSLGAKFLLDEVVDVEKKDEIFNISTRSGKVFSSQAILLATGTEHRRLELPEEKKFIGRGVSYCATCDAMFYKGKTVAVVGGSDGANTTSLYLAEIAEKVYQIYRRDKLRGETEWINQIEKNKKIKVIYNAEVTGLEGEEKLERITVKKDTGNKIKNVKIKTNGLFVEIGTIPQKDLLEKLSLDVDETGYVKVSPGQATNQEGVWAAGDITDGSNGFRQIITACGEGAVAAENIFSFFQGKKK
jgi:thioredoxin reductase (NADPH)